MKKVLAVFAIFSLIVFSASCSGTREATKFDDTSIRTPESDTLRLVGLEQDTNTEYEITIIEPGFAQWLVTQPPRGYWGIDYLERKNRFYVAEYNRRVIERSGSSLYLQQVPYDYKIDYGYELNYLLYNWFEYIQENNNFRLL